MSTSFFSHELREYRQGNGLSRKEMAVVLGVSESTVRSWENGKASPQSSTIWGVLDRLASPAIERISKRIDVARIRTIVADYAKSLELSPTESFQSKLLRIERTLSGSVLKAAQTDFQYDPKGRKLNTIPFYADMALFEAANHLEVQSLLENAADSANSIVSRLESVNIEQRYLSDALSDYAEQCLRKMPNPRILERKGSLIRFVFNNEDISKSVNQYLLKEIEQFIDLHNDLMRGLFGESLANSRLINSDVVSDALLGNAVQPFSDVTVNLDRIANGKLSFEPNAARIDHSISAIVSDVEKEVNELEVSATQANDPNTRALRVARLKVAAFHGALLIGRLLLRTTGAVLTHGANVAAIAGIVEIVSPGSIRASYELLRIFIPDLPVLPTI